MLKHILDQAPTKTVIVTGAGVSTPSGIPDFKTLDASHILSRDYANKHKERYYDFVETYLKGDVKPNHVHKLLAEYPFPIITQNIDGLHSGEVYEVHGSIKQSQCYCCGYKIDGDYTTHQKTKCPECKVTGAFEPAIVLYGDDLDLVLFVEVDKLLDEAEQIIVMGTRLEVNPIAYYVRDHTDKIIYINNEPTHGIPMDRQIITTF